MTGLADTVPADRHPKSCSGWFASDATTGEAICDCGLASESTVAGLYQHDLGVLLQAVGLPDYARSESAHMVVHDVLLPRLRALTQPSEPGLDAAWAEVEAVLDGRVLRIEYDPTVTDLPWMAEVVEATASGDNVAAHADADSPGGALEALLTRLSA